MIEQKRFAGILNLDDSPEFVLPNQHINSLNIRFYGGSNGLTAENFPGNIAINNTLPAGDNQAIGSVFDGLKLRLFWFNWNSNGRNGIYKYDIATNTISELLVSFTDSQDDILNFDLDFPIPSVNIIYTTEEDGDILTWTDRNNAPKELNILDAETNLFGANWLTEYLDVAKEPPAIPIVCAYENDNTVTVNNLKNKLYKFKYRFVYGTFQKSTWSTISEMPIPIDYTDSDVDTDQTKNCRIGLIFQTGGADVVKIEIAAQENLGVSWGNFFSIQILDKDELSIPDNDALTWRFYNNEAYDYVDVDESNLDFDRVPNKANTQELLNGNVIIYGGITEGYDPVVPEVVMSTTAVSMGYPNATVQILATQNGEHGLESGNIKISVVGVPVQPPVIIGVGGNHSVISVRILAGGVYYVLSANGSTIGISLADMLNLLATDALAQGFTIISQTADTLVINRANQTLINFYGYGNGADVKDPNHSVNSNEFSSSYNYGIVYFDEKGKNNGTTTSDDFNLEMPVIPSPYQIGAALNIYRVDMLIYHRPPLWAKTYQIVRTKNLTKENFVSLVSDRTFKDSEFAYISIESLNRYKIQHPTSVISYDFTVGDRIKFVSLFNNDKTVNTSYGNTRDYEIVGIEVNPNIDGLPQGGTFVKINLPTTTGTFDFGTILSNSFYYYYVELYTPAKSVANGLNVYYEFGQMFQIGNAGTVFAFHQGSNGLNQDPGGGPIPATPATIWMPNGDNYMRNREVRAGASFKANTVPDITYSWSNEPVYQQNIDTIPVGTSYQVKNTVAGNTSNLNNWLIKTGLVAVDFNISGKLTFQSLLTTANNLIVYLQIKNIGGGGVTLVQLATKAGAANGQIIEFSINSNVTIPANKTAVIYLQESPVTSPFAFSAKSVSGQLTFVDTEHDFTINVVDPNFSDFFESKVNSNGRTSVEEPDQKETKYDTLLRWGLSYQQNTNINQINRFFPANFDEIDRSKGEIQRMKSRDRILRIFQNRACSQYGVYTKFIQSNSGEVELVTTNDIITKGNVNYYAGTLGLGEQYTGLVSSTNADYGIDPVRGYEWRLSGDGLTPISQLYKGQFTLRDLMIPYNKPYLRTDGSKSKILGVYNYFDEEKITVLQGGTYGGSTIDNYAYSFNEKRNGYSSMFSFNQAEWLESAEDILYMWKNGQLWKLDIGNPSGSYCNYFGSQYDAYITIVFNTNLVEKKSWMSVAEIASAVWDCPVVFTNTKSYANQRQESMLGDYDFATLEDMFHAAFLRDIHSIGGILEGNQLKGNYCVVKFNKTNASDRISLSEVSVKFIDSPLTNR